MMLPRYHKGSPVFEFYTESWEPVTALFELPECYLVKFSDDKEPRSLAALTEHEWNLITCWLTFVRLTELVEAEQFGRSVERLVQTMKLTGSQTLGEVPERIERVGDEIERNLEGGAS